MTEDILDRKNQKFNDNWLKENCEEIEDYQRKHDGFNANKKINNQ